MAIPHSSAGRIYYHAQRVWLYLLYYLLYLYVDLIYFVNTFIIAIIFFLTLHYFFFFLYSNARQYEEALQQFHKAKAVREELLGNEHVDTCAVYNNIGAVLLTQNTLKPCLELFSKALEVFQVQLGMEHPRTTIVRRNLDLAHKLLIDQPRALPKLPAKPLKVEWENPNTKKKKKKKAKKKKWY